MNFAIFKEAYLATTLAVVVGMYLPWAEFNQFALRPFTEGTAVWLIFGLAPIAAADWLTAAAGWLFNTSRSLLQNR